MSKFPLSSLLLMVLISIVTLTVLPSVLGEGTGEITLINNNTLFMDYDEVIREVNNSPLAWSDDGVPIQFSETDRELMVEYSVLNRNFFTLKVINSPYGTENEYSFIYCTINEIPDYDRYAYHRENRCPYYYYAYKLRDIREGQLLTVKIPELINGTNAFIWYVGNGAGGGGGLPVCEGLATSMTLNQTSTKFNESFNMSGRALYLGASTAGCTANTLIWQMQNSTAYQIIPNETGTWKALSGRGVVMSQTNPVWQQWYYRYPFCEIGGRTVNLRMRFDGVYNLKATTVYSSVYTMECQSSYNTFLWTSPTPSNNSVIDTHSVTLNSSLSFYKNNTIFYSWNKSAIFYVPMDWYNVSSVRDIISNHGMLYKDGLSINSVIDGGLFGKALNFSNDETDFTLVNNSQDLDIGLDNFTFVIWLKPRGMSPTVTSDETIFAKYLNTNYRYYFRFRQADYFQFYAVINGVAHNYQVSTLNPYIQNNEWNLVVVQFNRTADKFFISINGEYSGATNTATGTGVNYSVNKELLIGGFSYDYSTGQAGFNGTMEEVSFHRRLFSLEEVQMLYKGQESPLNITFNNLPYGNYSFTAYHNNIFGFYNSSQYFITLAEANECVPPINAPFKPLINCSYNNEVVVINSSIHILRGNWINLFNSSLLFVH